MGKKTKKSQKRSAKRVVSPMPMSFEQIPVPQASYGRQLLVLAVAITMLLAVIGTFIVLNEVSSAEKMVEQVQGHRALNAMVVKQLDERFQQEKQYKEDPFAQEEGRE